jgi:hypothetical protein
MASPSGITHYEGRVEDAIDLLGKELWFGFLRSTTAWTDPDNPPSPTPGDTTIVEPYLYVKADAKSLCRTASDGEYTAAAEGSKMTVGGVKYIFVSEADAYDEFARWVYVRCLLAPMTVHPEGTFREIRVYSGVTPATGHESDLWLAPANVSSVGRIRWVRNYVMVAADNSSTWTAHVVIEKR